MFQNKSAPKGFTLVELIVVITIIGILAITLVPKIISAPRSARDSAREASLEEIRIALEVYNSENLDYPDSGSGWVCLNSSSSVYNALVDGGYISGMPTDPLTGNNVLGCADGSFRYLSLVKSLTPNQAFILAAEVEMGNKANVGWDDIKNFDNESNVTDVLNDIETTTTINGDAAYVIWGD